MIRDFGTTLHVCGLRTLDKRDGGVYDRMAGGLEEKERRAPARVRPA